MQKVILICLLTFCLFNRVSSFGGDISLDALTAAQGLSLSSASMGADLGVSIASCDFNGDTIKDVIIGAPNAYSGSGAVIIIFGGSNFATVDLSNPAASNSGMILTAIGETGFGTKVVCLGNVNSGSPITEDLLIGNGAPTKFWAVFGQTSFSSNQDISSLLKCEITAPSYTLLDAFAIGDVTGDNYGDAVISLYDGTSVYSAVLIMDFSGSTIDASISSAPSWVYITNSAQSVPMSFSRAGNFNGDSYDDFVVGNLQGDTIFDQSGVICGTDGAGSPYPDIELSVFTYASFPRVLFIMGDYMSQVGASVGYAGKVNGDIFDDIIIGNPGVSTDIGAAFIVFGSGSFAGQPDLPSMPGNSEGYKITHGATATGPYLGTTVFGDLSTGSNPAVAVCDWTSDCYVSFVSAPTTDVDTMLSEDGFKISNSLVTGSNPMQIVLIDDVNSDGISDYLISQKSIATLYIVYGLNKCTSPCKTCNGLGSANWGQCTSCETGFNFLYNLGCYASCPSHSYQDSGTTCATCAATCKDCTASTATDCSNCDSAGSYPLFYLNSCYATASCPSHAYQDSSTTCASCHASCLDCTGAGASACSSCDSGGSYPLFYNSACYAIGSCPSHSYQDSSTTCASCHASCLDCTAAGASACSSCDSGGSYPLFYNSACYAIGSCPSHSYQSSGTTCATCNSKCLECTGAGTSACSSCDSGGSYPLFYSNACYAVGSCPSGAFQDSSTTCAACDGNCKNCGSSATTCTSCDQSGSTPLLYSSVCYSSCPPAAPYSYSYVCYTECPSGTAADSSNACVTSTTTVEVPKAVETLSSTDETRQVSNEVMSAVSTLFLGGGVHSIRSQSVQGPVSYYIFMNVDYPDNYGQFAKSNYGSSRMPNPFKNTGKSGGGRVKSVNAYIDNQSLLANIGYSVMYLTVCVLLIPINDAALAALQKHKKGSQSKWYHRTLQRSSVSLRWSFLINQFVSKYQDLAFFSFLGLYNSGAEDSDDRDTLNLVVCIFGFLITVSGLAGAYLIIKSLTKKLESFSEEEKEKEEYNKDDFLGRRIVLFKDLKKDRLMTMLYPFFLMVRVFGFCFVTIFLCNVTGIQLGFLNLYAVLMLVYLFKYRPLEENGQLWMTVAYEIDGFVALLGVTLLAIYNKADGTNESTRAAFGYMIIIANTGMLVLNFISFFLEMSEYVMLAYEKLKTVYQKLKNRKKVVPEPVESISPTQEKGLIYAKLKMMRKPEPVQSLDPDHEFELQSPVIGTPSAIAEGQRYFNEDGSPGLPSPKSLSEMRLSPYSSYIEGNLADDKSALIKLENSMSPQTSSPRKRFTIPKASIKYPVEEVPEVDI